MKALRQPKDKEIPHAEMYRGIAQATIAMADEQDPYRQVITDDYDAVQRLAFLESFMREVLAHDEPAFVIHDKPSKRGLDTYHLGNYFGYIDKLPSAEEMLAGLAHHELSPHVTLFIACRASFTLEHTAGRREPTQVQDDGRIAAAHFNDFIARLREKGGTLVGRGIAGMKEKLGHLERKSLFNIRTYYP